MAKAPVILTDLEKIKQERARLDGIYKDLPQDIKKTADKLIANAAFMAVTLDSLAAIISEKGCTEQYQNGANQSGTKKSVEVDVYNTMIKNYKSIVDTLLGLLLPREKGEDNDGFDDFVEDRED